MGLGSVQKSRLFYLLYSILTGSYDCSVCIWTVNGQFPALA